MPRIEIDLTGWKSYVSQKSGILLFADTSNQSTLPIRNQIDDEGNALQWEPDYATGTFGLRTCQTPKILNSIVKARHSYIFYATRYNGLDPEYKNKYLVYGYMKIGKVRDVRDRHLSAYLRDPELPPPECLNLKESMAIWAEEQKFCDLPDALVLDDETVKRWGYQGRVTRQMKFVVEGESLSELLNHFAGKADFIEEYIGTVNEFVEALNEEEDEE